MSFSQEWEQRYSENTHMSIWPWSDLISLVRRHCKLDSNCRVLEIGCGAGANIPFFLSLGIQYYALEGSPTAVNQLHIRFPDLASRIRLADFSKEQPFPEKFELVVDRGSLTCNSTVAIANTLDLVWQSLRPGGYFIGVDLYSVNHSEFASGQPDADANTRSQYSEGMLAGIGRVHFSDADHLRMLFSRFELIFLEEKLLRRVMPASNYQIASWHVVARKPLG